MTRRPLLSRLQCCAVLSVLGLACGSASKSPGSSPAKLAPTDTSQLPVLKVDQVFAPQAPTTHGGRLFTVEEFQQKAAQMGYASDVTASTTITLSNGNTVTVGDLVDQLNRLEPGFNKMQLSLRDEQPGPFLLQETDISMDTTGPAAQAPVNLPADSTNFQPYTWIQQFGATDGPVRVEVRTDAVANSGVNDITSELSSGVTAVIGGQLLPIFATNAQASLPVPLAAMDRRYAMSTWGFMAAMVPSGYYAAPGLEAHNSAIGDHAYVSPQVDFGAMVGPIPVVVALGVNGDVGVNSGADVYEDEARALVGPTFAAQLFASATAGLPIVSLGIEGMADLVRFTPGLSSDVQVTENGTQPTNIDWTYGLSAEVSALKGEIRITATVDLWLLGKRMFQWVLVTWPGTQVPVFQTGQTQHITRPALNPMPMVVEHEDVAPAQGLGQAGDITFGGPCPDGMVRSECRAYQEQSSSVSCQVPRWVTADPHDCSCTFTVASGPADQTLCGADVWAVSAQ